jgi:enoyl-CoA hydratase
MTYENLVVDIADEIGTLLINRPKALNALNGKTLHEIQAAFQDLEKDTTVKVIILTGTGDRAFVAGADILEMKNMGCLEAVHWSEFGHTTLDQIEGSSKVVIAAVNGFALGGGTEIALACDFIVAAENARFGFPEVTLGVFPGFGGTQRLPRLIGKGPAKELIFTGTMISAQEAKQRGIVNHVFPGESLIEETHKIARTIAANGPRAIQLAKKAIDTGYDLDLKAGCHMEAVTFGTCFTTTDQKEGMTAFVEKRKPRFTGE